MKTLMTTFRRCYLLVFVIFFATNPSSAVLADFQSVQEECTINLTQSDKNPIKLKIRDKIQSIRNTINGFLDKPFNIFGKFVETPRNYLLNGVIWLFIGGVSTLLFLLMRNQLNTSNSIREALVFLFYGIILIGVSITAGVLGVVFLLWALILYIMNNIRTRRKQKSRKK